MFNFPNLLDSNLTVENIHKKVTDAEIFRHYFGDYKIGKYYKSPLRGDDLVPSFNFYVKNDQIRYKDWGHSEGSCFDFIKLLKGLSFRETLCLINQDMNLGLNGATVNHVVKYDQYSKLKLEDTKTYSKVILRDWQEYDKKYWEQYKIKSQTLIKFNIYPGKELWTRKDGYDWNKTWINTQDNPMYVYLIKEYELKDTLYFDKQGIKCYRPYQTTEYNRNPRFKWFTGVRGNYIQGLEQLPKFGNILFITSSLKDVCTLHEIGISAIAPNAEGTPLPAKLIDYLKTRFKDIYVNYDSDDPGVNASIKFTQQFNLNYWNIPKEYETKDVSDFVKKYSQKELIELIKNKINF